MQAGVLLCLDRRLEMLPDITCDASKPDTAVGSRYGLPRKLRSAAGEVIRS